MGMLSALIAAAAWLVLATFLNLPVSTTHGMGAHARHARTNTQRARTHAYTQSPGGLTGELTREVAASLHRVVAVGAIVGFTLVAKGFDGVEWWQIGKICISWVSSPVLGSRLLPAPSPFFFHYWYTDLSVRVRVSSGTAVVHHVLPGPLLHPAEKQFPHAGVPLPALLLRPHPRYSPAPPPLYPFRCKFPRAVVGSQSGNRGRDMADYYYHYYCILAPHLLLVVPCQAPSPSSSSTRVRLDWVSTDWLSG